jgi:serine protease Do
MSVMMRRTLAVLVMFLAMLAEANAAVAGAAAPANQAHEDDPARMRARRTPVVEVFENNRDAVVNISAKEIVTVRDPWGGGIDSLFEEFFDMPRAPTAIEPRTRQITRTSVGSGFVIHADGYLVTNAHVVAQTAERKAVFSDGREYDAQIVAFDTQRDLAVLKIEAEKPLPIIKLGRSNDLMIGETVVAIGNPLGFQNTVTAGVISATERQLDFARGQSLTGLIQTDASINHGNSGGPLLNVLGELIGVNTAIRGDAQNIGFAIPVDQLREVLPDLLDVERRYRIVAGLTVDTVGPPVVTRVQPDSPAAKAGVREGDLLTKINGRAVNEGVDYCIGLIGHRANDEIELSLQRSGKTVSATLTLDGRPAPDGPRLAQDRLGMVLEPLTDDIAQAIGFPQGVQGLVVTQLEQRGPAAEAGIQLRDVLIAIGRHTVATTDDLGQLLEFVDSGERVPVTVLRVERRMKMKLSGELQAR